MSEAMEAGRDLDALIAERLFGFTWVSEWNEYPGPHIITADGILAGWRREDGGVTAHLDGIVFHPKLPPYSTDIAAAWLVVEKMREREVSTEVAELATLRLAGVPCASKCLMWWYAPDCESHQVERLADTAPLAICKAALAALSTQETGTNGQ